MRHPPRGDGLRRRGPRLLARPIRPLAPLLLWPLLACRAADAPATGPVDPTTPPSTPLTATGSTASDTDATGPTGATGHSAHTGAPALQATGVADAHALTVDLRHRQGPVAVHCTVPTDAAEEHHHRADDDTIRLRGLLADTEHHCTVSDDDTVIPLVVRTQPSPVEATWSLPVAATDRMQGHYTLFNHGKWGDDRSMHHRIVLVDPEGRVRWVKIMDQPAPDLDATILPDGTLLYGDGQHWRPTMETLDGELLWTAPPSTTGRSTHHHAEQLPSGEIVTLVHSDDVDPVSGETWTGFTIERWDPTTDQLTWSWSSQRGVDEGWLVRGNRQQSDPWHANALVVHGDITYVNLRQHKWLVALNADGSKRWTLGPTAGSDLGLVDASGAPIIGEAWFYGPHAPERHEGDRWLLYDNGFGRPGGGSSRAVELVIDEALGHAMVTWSWWGDAPPHAAWYEPIWGDIDELPGGHVLLTKGHCASCAEDQRSGLVEVDRASGEVVWWLEHRDQDDAAYRAQRLDGCDLFHNRRYCAR